MAPPIVTAVVVTYRSKDHIETALAPLVAAHERGWLECIVIDNGSDDGTADLVQRDHPWVRLVRNRRNHGFGRACNTGIRLANGSYVLLLNPDARLDSAGLQVLLDFMQQHPRAGIVSPAVVLPDGSTQSAWQFPSPAGVLAQAVGWHARAPKATSVPPGASPFVVEWMAGAVMLLRSEMLRATGAFDPRYFLYFEETDLCQRARLAGWEVWAVGGAVADHVHGASARAAGGVRVHDCLAEHFYPSRLYYLAKHFGWARASVVEVLEPPLLIGRELVRRLAGRTPDVDSVARLSSPWFRLPARTAGGRRPPGEVSRRLLVARELLALCLLGPQLPSASRSREVVLSADAEELIDALGTLLPHRALPAIWAAAGRHGLQHLPGLEPARVRYQLTQLQNGLRMQQFATLLERLRGIGVQPLLLKGIALLNSAYADLGERSMEDIDFLIRREELERVEKALVELGYVRRSATHDAVQYVAPGGLVLDVHHHLRAFDGVDLAAHSLRVRPSHLAVDEIAILDPNVLLAHLCVHFAGHMRTTGCMLVWLLDIGHVLRIWGQELDWPLVLRLLADEESVAALLRVAGFLESELGFELPPALAPPAREVPPLTLEEVIRARRRGTARAAGVLLHMVDRFVGRTEKRVVPSPQDILAWPRDVRRQRRAKGWARRNFTGQSPADARRHAETNGGRN